MCGLGRHKCIVALYQFFDTVVCMEPGTDLPEHWDGDGTTTPLGDHGAPVSKVLGVVLVAVSFALIVAAALF